MLAVVSATDLGFLVSFFVGFGVGASVGLSVTFASAIALSAAFPIFLIISARPNYEEHTALAK